TRSNRNAVGAKVWLKAGGLTQVDEGHSGDSYISHSDWRAHFGLGSTTRISEVIIKWPSGTTEKLTNLPIDKVVTVVEGKSSSKVVVGQFDVCYIGFGVRARSRANCSDFKRCTAANSRAA